MPPKVNQDDGTAAIPADLVALIFAAHPDIRINYRDMASYSTTLTVSAIEHRLRHTRTRGRQLAEEKENAPDKSIYNEEAKKKPARVAGAGKAKKAVPMGQMAGGVLTSDDDDNNKDGTPVQTENDNANLATPTKRGRSELAEAQKTTAKKAKKSGAGVSRKVNKKPEKIEVSVEEENDFINDDVDEA